MKFVDQCLWSQASTANPSFTSSVDTSLLNGLSGSKSISPDYWVQGASFRISGFGQARAVSGFATPTMKLKIGSTVIASTPVVIGTTGVDVGWMFDGQVTYLGSNNFVGMGILSAGNQQTDYGKNSMVPASVPVNIPSLSSPLDLDLVVNLITSEWTFFKMLGGRCVRGGV